MIVTRRFSYTCEIVSLPEPVVSMYAAELGLKIVKVAEGRPLGEMLTCWPVRGAEAVKKTCWERAWEVVSWNLGSR